MGKRKQQARKRRRVVAPVLRSSSVEIDLPPELLALVDVDQVLDELRRVCPICAEGRGHS